ncbi:MAG: ABC transporter transmembrane domain-containing protein [Candidatus Calescibacterium sp.]|nr:ABC transporter transmembrane domain-containing protein [Candidatus Calescibacterium sp.]MCX7734714.1 ABC transporter transmembrane domain-containing protein [bacterium]MDW8087304.1 ABC transporter transmembrane domain-containing protein [Candidatus Calescibacterium sp.]
MLSSEFKTGIRILANFIKRYKKEYAKGIAFSIISAMFSALIPMIIRYGIDLLESGTNYKSVIFTGSLIALFGMSRSILLYIGRNHIVITGRLIERDMREKTFEKLLITKTEFFDKEGTGKISSQIINDIENVRMMLGFGGMIISHIAPVFVFSLILEFFISPILATIALIPLVFIPIIVITHEKKIFELSELVQEKISEITNFSQEIFSKIKIIKNFTIEDKVGEKFSHLSSEYKKSNLTLSKQRAIFESLIVLFSMLSIVAVIIPGYHLLDIGVITKGDLAGFIAYQLILAWPAMAIGYLFAVIQRGVACLWRINRIFEQPQEIPDLSVYYEHKNIPK